MLLEGIFLPLTTPFHADGRLYLHKLEHNVARYSKTPAAGMVVLGAAGEADALTDDETVAVLKTAIGAAGDEKVMVAGVGRASVVATLVLVEAAAAAGYDAAFLKSPAFVTEAEKLLYFQAVADRSPLPIVADRFVEHPQIVGAIGLFGQAMGVSGMSREVTVTTTFAAVTGRMLRATRGNFVSAASLSAGNVIAPPMPTVKTRTKRVGFQVLAGSIGTMLDAWQAGAVGAVPNLGACAPQACCEVWQAYRDGDLPLAEEKQERVRGVGATVEAPGAISLLKYGCDLNGYFGGRARLPAMGLTGDQRREMDRDLAGLGN